MFLSVFEATHVVGNDLFDTEVPGPVDGGLGEAGEQFSVGGTLHRKGVPVALDLVLRGEGKVTEGGQGEARADAEEGGEVALPGAHFASR